MSQALGDRRQTQPPIPCDPPGGHPVENHALPLARGLRARVNGILRECLQVRGGLLPQHTGKPVSVGMTYDPDRAGIARSRLEVKSHLHGSALPRYGLAPIANHPLTMPEDSPQCKKFFCATVSIPWFRSDLFHAHLVGENGRGSPN
jgi:hypothetical protein